MRFEVADIENATFGERFELAFSRMGTMFFANPVAALRNVREALHPNGRLVMVVWRAKFENDWPIAPNDYRAVRHQPRCTTSRPVAPGR